jgi:Putative glycolipid-binding
MPFGRYTVFDDGGNPVGIEEFRCAPGPMGWRTFSQVQTSVPSPHAETLDVAVNADWRIARVRIDTGEHDLLLEPNAAGDALTGYRDRRPIELAYGPDDHLDYFTPATNAITTRRLTGTAEIDVVYLEPVTLQPSRVRQRYELIGDERVETPVGAFDATRWRFRALGSGWTSDLWVAGDIVVRYERLFELEWLDPGASGPRPVER